MRVISQCLFNERFVKVRSGPTVWPKFHQQRQRSEVAASHIKVSVFFTDLG